MSRITDFARDQNCQLRLPGHCNFDPSTSVCCHIRLPGVAGIALKPSDLITVIGCDACHSVIDGRHQTDIPRDKLAQYILEGMARTQLLYLSAGLVSIN
jgi:hypothetical protein